MTGDSREPHELYDVAKQTKTTNEMTNKIITLNILKHFRTK